MSNPQSFTASRSRTGRPVGCVPKKSQPANIAEFVQSALANPPKPPSPIPKRPRTPGRSAGVWDGMTPDQRSAYGKHLASLRKPENMARRLSGHSTPHGWTTGAANVAKAAARLEAQALVAKLKAQGTIAPEDEAATVEALAVVKSPGAQQPKVQAARQLLRFYHPECAGLI